MIRKNTCLTTIFVVGVLAPTAACFSPSAPVGQDPSTTDLPPPDPSSGVVGSASASSGTPVTDGSDSSGDDSTSAATDFTTTSTSSPPGTSGSETTGLPPSTCDLVNGVGPDYECSTYTQDCPQGERCVPLAKGKGYAWNATRCEPIPQDPLPVGSRCETLLEGDLVDLCDAGSQCWNNECTPMCTCDASGKHEDCPAEYDICHQSFEGTIAVCISACDPTDPATCQGNMACLHVPHDSKAHPFQCIETPGDAAIFGEPCEFPNACAPDLACAPAAAVPGCKGEQCCTTFCDLAIASASQSCPGYSEGQECLPFFNPGFEPPGYEHVGLCSTP